MRPNAESTDESVDEQTSEWAGVGRRPLLKALGVGATLSFGGGMAAAAGDRFDAQDNGDGGGQPIDPNFGYPTTDATDLPESLTPDHEVELKVVPPMPPSQPPLIHFDPAGLRVDAGDIVQFTAVSPDHTVTAYHPEIGPKRRIPENADPFSSPVMGPGWAWLYRFEEEGVYDVYCGPHHVLGMVMRLTVGDIAEQDLPEYATSVESLPSREDISRMLNEMSEENENCEWPFLMPATVIGTDALDPMNVQEAGKVPFETVANELGYELQPPESPTGNETAGGNTTADNTTVGTATDDTDGTDDY